MPNLYSGTSGFAYPSWKPEFYPEKLPSKKFLSYYATRLNAVEVNYTFRRLPSASTLENWVNDTRPGFVFPLKAHMRITHILRLKPSEFTEYFFARSIRCGRHGGWGRCCSSWGPRSNAMKRCWETFWLLYRATFAARLSFDTRLG